METSFVIRLIIWIFGTAILVYTLLKKITKKKLPINNEQDKYWFLYFIYFNPNDRRIFLSKRSGLGITLNFAKLSSWLILALIIFVIIFLIFSKK